jgi:hypothetical protein
VRSDHQHLVIFLNPSIMPRSQPLDDHASVPPKKNGGLSSETHVGPPCRAGVAGERLARRVRVRVMASMLERDIGWFDRRDNNPSALTAQLAEDCYQASTPTKDQALR